ncbi:MAG: hypothetical protein A3D92_15605 [Bacteroidetes bacterium RIFCSPHIGHO2_02_FULL_44_7]|nr:MAG: hypothetical protein A3D92_15605 [Bacteroidetes bacterium RIFCSPHIGHO2_02_FULL_44_7]
MLADTVIDGWEFDRIRQICGELNSINMKQLIVLGMLLILAACGTKEDHNGPEVVQEMNEPYGDEMIDLGDDIPEQRSVYRESETVLTDLVHTKLEVNFDWEKSRMNGVETLTARPHFYASDSLILDAKGMIINSVIMNGKPTKYVYTDDYLRIKLDKTYTRKEQYTVVIDYVARPEERVTGGSAAILSDKGLYFINPTGADKNKMPQIWTQGETEASSVWFPTIDAPNAKTTQEIFMTVDDKYATLSNGKLVSSRKLPDSKREDHWKQELPHAPYLFMMGVGEFKVVRDIYKRQDGTEMEVNYYVEPEWEAYAKDIFGETPEMIRFFSELMKIEYPWDKYHQIVCRDYVSGAMENTGAVVFGDYVYKNKRELLDGNDQSTIAHELFHHWFGDLVTCESWSNLTLNESFANYSQYLWDEHRYGKDEADYNAELEADGYYQSAQMQGYHDLVWFDYDDKEQMFDGHSYNKGGRILHMLRNYLGDEAFFEGMHRYLEQNKFKAAEFHQLRLAFEEVSGEDLNWFFNQWYQASGHPTLTFNQEINESEGTITVTVQQGQDLELSPIFRLPIQMAIFDNDGKHVHKVLIDELEETFVFPYKGEVKGIIYDEQQMLLAKTNEEKTTEQFIFQFYNSDRFVTRREGLLKGTRDRGEAGQRLVLDAMKDPFWEIRRQAIKKMSKLQDAMKEEGIALLKDILVNDPSSAVRSAALSQLEKYMQDEELITLYRARIKDDPSYEVVTTALKSYGKMAPKDAMKAAEAMETEASSKMIAGITSLYANNAGPEKYDFMQAAVTGNVVQGFDKLGALNSFTMYISGQEPELAGKALAVYQETGKNGGFYMKMFMPQNVEYLVGKFNAKASALKIEAKKEADAGNPALADQLAEKAARFEALSVSYTDLKVALESETGEAQIIISGGDEE